MHHLWNNAPGAIYEIDKMQYIYYYVIVDQFLLHFV